MALSDVMGHDSCPTGCNGLSLNWLQKEESEGGGKTKKLQKKRYNVVN